MAQLNVAELDFDGIKANLKQFLSQQEEFADYNFDGAGLSVLIDLLAYNTHYNATLAHLLSNEMFIDSAVKRSSAVSIAKALGYTPTSTRSARLFDATITVVPPAEDLGLYRNATISRTTEFRGTSPTGTVYSFYPKETVYADLSDDQFLFTVDLIQGKRVTQSFTITTENVSGPLVLNNADIDTTTILVRVKQSATQEVLSQWNAVESILDVDGESEIFFIEENGSGKHELRFGDNVLGKALLPGNIVFVEYLVSSGQLANGIRSLTTSATIVAEGESVYVSEGPTSGGAPKQTLDSIRYIAPKFNATKNRAVTKDDYQALIYSRYSNINSITVWGGEENDPPIYGKVFICIEPLAGSFVTQQDKDMIVKEVLEPRGVVGIQAAFVDPEYTYISLNVNAKFNARKSTLSSSQIQGYISEQINNYFVNDIAKVKKNFYYSELLDNILQTTNSLYSVNLDVTLHKRHTPYLGEKNTIDFKFDTPLRPGTVRSCNFNTILAGGSNAEVYIADTYTTSNTNTLTMFRVEDDSPVSYSVGTVNYETGRIKFPALLITGISGNGVTFRVYSKCQHNSPDVIVRPLRNTEVSTEAVFANPSKSSVIARDNTVANTESGYLRGLNISVVGTNN
jgi:hypothetical protein